MKKEETSCRQEYIRWKSAHESGGGGFSCGKGHHLLYSEGSGGLPRGKIILRGLGDFPGENHSEGSGGLPRGKLIPRGLRDLLRGKSFRGVWGTSQWGIIIYQKCVMNQYFSIELGVVKL